MANTFHQPGATRTFLSAAFAVASLLGLLLAPGTAAAQDMLPHPPCGGTSPYPAYPVAAASDAAPAIVQVWQSGKGVPRWIPPTCTGWIAGPKQGFRTLLALAGRIQLAGGAEQLLDRFGAISALQGVRYWSTSDGGWRPLVSSAWALEGPDPARRRADFKGVELRRGQEVYFVQHDSRSSGDVVYRMRMLESGTERIVIETENVTSIQFMLTTLFQPGALQTVYFLQRLAPDSWGYYGLFRTTEEGSSFLAGGHEASYVNRAAALYRLVAGVPTDRDPPMAQ